LTGYQLVRVIAFVNVYGGLEHDGGWALGVSRALVEYGVYTSLVSTIEDPAAIAAVNVDGRFEVQAPNGGIWFRISDVAGPSILFDALILKLFGTDFWALVAGPLIFYALMLLLGAIIVYQLAGLGAVVLFHLFVFCYPHLSIFLSYQALREVPGMAMILLAYLAFASAVQKQSRRGWFFLLAGICCGLAINTKLITLFSLCGIFGWAVLLWLRGQPRLCFAEIVLLGVGTALIPAIWEVVQWVVLTQIAGFEIYLRRMQQRFDFVLDGGSGLREQTYSGAEFIWDKFFMLSWVAHPERWVTALIFAGIVGGGLAVLFGWRSQLSKHALFGPIWVGWLVNTAWFVGIAKTGWPRHYWFGLILAALLLAVIPLTLVKTGWPSPKPVRNPSSWWLSLAAGLLLLGLLSWGFVLQPYVWHVYLPDEIVPYWQELHLTNKYRTGLPWIIVPRAAQAEVVEYIKRLPPEANVYYPLAHKGAEIPALTGRIQYPLNRRKYPGVTPNPADVLLIPPVIVSSWTHDPPIWQALQQQVEQACPEPELKNDFYVICKVEKLRPM
jgi:hypothetical protein